MSKSHVGPGFGLALVVAALAAASGEVRAQYYARGAGVRAGSVRYGGYTAAAGRGVVAGGSVRYGGAAYAGRAVVRTPFGTTYSSAYAARLPSGYSSMVVGGRTYAYYPALPTGYRPVTVGGTRYFWHNNVYYKSTVYGGRTVYMAVPPPR